MKHITIILFFFLFQASEVGAQCQSPITISQLITLKTNFVSAEDLLLECYWKSEVETMKYSNGDKGQHWTWFNNTRIDAGNCTASKNNIGFFEYNGGIIYTTYNSQEFLEKKRFIRANGQKNTSSISDAEAFKYKNLIWEFYIGVNEQCRNNYYSIVIGN
jgi:hypothetical protein